MRLSTGPGVTLGRHPDRAPTIDAAAHSATNIQSTPRRLHPNERKDMPPVTISAESADAAWQKAWHVVRQQGHMRPNDLKGGSHETLHVYSEIINPRERWVAARYPRMNPAFALAEVVWILRGRSDIAFLTPWNSNLTQFVGDDAITHGAYGRRLRHEHGLDQLTAAYQALSSNPTSRQVALSIWKPDLDLPNSDGTPQSSDIPCNVVSLLKIADGTLRWTQIMRSNDLIRGLPYNIVQWTTIQEVFAGWLDVEVGPYTHLADSLHVYDRDIEKFSLVPVPPVANTDDLRLPYAASALAIETLESAFEELASYGDHRSLTRIVDTCSAPEPYLDWVRVLAAERLRRLRLSPQPVTEQISSPALRRAFHLWAEDRTPRA